MTRRSSAERASPAAAGIATVVTYLEMTAPPARAAAAAPAGQVEVRHAVAPTVSFYRFLYGAVGEPWQWLERRHVSDAALTAILLDPRVEVHVLWVGGVPAGYVELDERRSPDLELAYFGLMPEFIGRGLGRFFLDWAVDRGWQKSCRRLWVHTCDLDHPRALALYQRAGFRVYQTRSEAVPLPASRAAAQTLS